MKAALIGVVALVTVCSLAATAAHGEQGFAALGIIIDAGAEPAPVQFRLANVSDNAGSTTGGIAFVSEDISRSFDASTVGGVGSAFGFALAQAHAMVSSTGKFFVGAGIGGGGNVEGGPGDVVVAVEAVARARLTDELNFVTDLADPESLTANVRFNLTGTESASAEAGTFQKAIVNAFASVLVNGQETGAGGFVQRAINRPNVDDGQLKATPDVVANIPVASDGSAPLTVEIITKGLLLLEHLGGGQVTRLGCSRPIISAR